jgi:hypothetical protein
VRGPFADGQPFAGDVAAVCVDGRWGLVDRSGVLVVPARHDRLASPGDGRVAVWMPYDRTYTTVDGRQRFVPDPDQVVVDITAVEVEGYADEDKVRQYVARQRSGFRGCVRNHLADLGEPEGTLVVVMRSEPGLPTRRSQVAESTLGLPDLEQCMTRRLRRGQPGPGAAGPDGGTATIHITLDYRGVGVDSPTTTP